MGVSLLSYVQLWLQEASEPSPSGRLKTFRRLEQTPACNALGIRIRSSGGWRVGGLAIQTTANICRGWHTDVVAE